MPKLVARVNILEVFFIQFGRDVIRYYDTCRYVNSICIM